MENCIAAAYHFRFYRLPKKSIMIISTTSQFVLSGKRRGVLFSRVDIRQCESLSLDTPINDCCVTLPINKSRYCHDIV